MSKYNALIVDDSPTMRQFLVMAVARIGDISYDEAPDGVEALKLSKKNKYDIALLDINMPQLDGIRLLKMLRSDPRNASMRVVVISTESAPQTKDEVTSLGADAFLTKPVVSRQVTETVKKLLAGE
jgi:two-component system chemotaxis response regulator CheY